jgi:hypothetical protein
MDAHPKTASKDVLETALMLFNPFLFAGPNWSKKNIGSYGQYYCKRCGGIESFHYQVRYIYIHILFVFSFVVRREYVMACGCCNTTLPVETKNIEEFLNHKDPGPFIRRRGWALCLAVLAMAIAVWLLGNLYERTVSGHHINSPESGDLYLVDFSRIPGSEKYQVSSRFYGYMKVLKVESNHLTFAPSYSYLNVTDSHTRDAMRSNPAQFEFSDRDAITLERPLLRELLGEEAILAVHRSS